MKLPTTSYSLRIDEADKQKAEQVFRALGMTFATGMNIYIKKVGQEQRIPFDLAVKDDVVKSASPKTSKLSDEKRVAYQELRGILSGHEVDLDKMREERILSK